MSERITYWRFVRWPDVPAHEANGWRIAFDLGHPHDRWSVGMEWTGEGEPS